MRVCIKKKDVERTRHLTKFQTHIMMKSYHKSLQKNRQLELFSSSNYAEEHSLIGIKIDTDKEHLSAENNTPNLTLNAKCHSSRRKPRRAKGEGTGHLFCKPLHRKTFFGEKTYEQWWYQWSENGVRKSRYVKKKSLRLVRLLEENKHPVSEILEVLNR